MKLLTPILLIAFLTTMLFGCDVQVEGYVLQAKPNKILVVDNLEPSEFEEISTKSIDEIMNEGLSLTYYSYEDSKLFQKGDRVRIWTSGYAQTSYPSQATATKIEVIE